MKYDYIQALTQDVNNYIDETYANDPDFTNAIFRGKVDKLTEELWGEDSVTGNGAYGYCARNEALSHLDGNMDLLEIAGCELGADWKKVALNPIYADCLIRCYLLYNVVYDVCTKRYEQFD